MYKRVHQYLDKKEILYHRQFGSHTATCALLSIVDKINEAIDYHDYACGVFLDLRKTVLQSIKIFWFRSFH